MRKIKFRGQSIGNHYVYGLLTKKKLRSNGQIVWAIATGNCSQAETIPVSEDSIAQLVGYDKDGVEVYEGDAVELIDGSDGGILTAQISPSAKYGDMYSWLDFDSELFRKVEDGEKD